MEIYVLKYVFHIYKIDLTEKETEIRTMFFTKIEDLIAEYRAKKNFMFMGSVHVCSDFKLYTAKLKEADLNMIEHLL